MHLHGLNPPKSILFQKSYPYIFTVSCTSKAEYVGDVNKKKGYQDHERSCSDKIREFGYNDVKYVRVNVKKSKLEGHICLGTTTIKEHS